MQSVQSRLKQATLLKDTNSGKWRAMVEPSPFEFDPRSKRYRLRSEGWDWQSQKQYAMGPAGVLGLKEDATIAYFPNAFQDSEFLYSALQSEVVWERKTVHLYGRDVEQPREISYMADDRSLVYTYSRSTLRPSAYSPTVAEIKERLEKIVGASFNCALLNYYRDGRDHMGWHGDDEPLMGNEPIIASVSLGMARAFDIRNNDNHKIKWRYLLGGGDVLVMRGGLIQREWKHAVPANKTTMNGRINLTFRRIIYPEKRQE